MPRRGGALSEIRWSAEGDNAEYGWENAAKKAMTLVRSRLRGRGPNPDATVPPPGDSTTAQSAPVVTAIPCTKKREGNVPGRLAGGVARDGADVMEVMANGLLDGAVRLGKIAKAGHMAGLPVDSPNLPLTPREVEKKRVKRHEC